jgi:acyl-CoA synthetase (AMP-forming)/AMP-acid ligase II
MERALNALPATPLYSVYGMTELSGVFCRLGPDEHRGPRRPRLRASAGRIDGDGYLYLEDRVKDMIITGGENVYPAEVERVLGQHPDVAEVAVIGVPDEKWGETVKAVVVPAERAAPDEAALIAFTRDRLAHYKCPTSVSMVPALPRNPTGKILKRQLRSSVVPGL